MLGKTSKRRLFLQLGVLLLLLGVVAQAGVQTGGVTDSPISAMRPAGGPMSGPSGDAQEAPVTLAGANGIVVGRSVHHDVSPPLRDMKPVPVEPWTEVRQMPEYDTVGGKPSVAVKDTALQSSFQMNPLAIPAPSKNFAGQNNRNGVYPPDPSGDVGPNHYVQWVNLSIQMWDKNGVSVFGPVNGNTLWQGFGGPCESQNSGDPIVLYDQLAGRWVLSQFTTSSPYGECVAVSTTSDPTGSYHRYFFQHSTSVLYDYPHMGVWPDGYYTTFNKFQCGVITCTYQGAAVVVYNRSAMLNGQAASFQEIGLSSSYGYPLPSDLDGPTAPPAGAPNYLVATNSNTGLNMWRFSVNWSNPSLSSLTGPTAISGVSSWNVLCSNTRNCIPQPGTSQGLDGIGDRLMFRLAYRNFGTHESLVVNHSVNAAASGIQAAVRWYEIRNPGGTPSVYQQGTYSPDATNRWMGSVAMDGSGNIGLSYTVSSSSVYPSIRYTGRLAGDPLGTLQAENTLVAGSGSQTGTGARWGDYSQITVDPVDDCTFWFTHEYLLTTGTAPWVTRIGAFKFPECGGGGGEPTPTPTNTPAPTNTPTPGTSNSMHVGDLDGSSVNNGNSWTANVTITVHDANENPVSNATVNGSWSAGATGTSQCVTNGSGQCTVSKSSIRKNVSSVTFSVSSVTHGTLVYDSGLNHDPDGDSNGTTIQVAKP